jgi:hypothetical protein
MRTASSLPKHHVMLKENGVLAAEGDISHRNQLPFHLADAGAEFQFGHIAQARGLTPAGITDDVLDIELRPAGDAVDGVRRILPAAPVTGDSLQWVHDASAEWISIVSPRGHVATWPREQIH